MLFTKPRPPRTTRFPYTTLFRSVEAGMSNEVTNETNPPCDLDFAHAQLAYSIIENLIEHTRIVSDLIALMAQVLDEEDRKSTRLNSSHSQISYAVFCLKKKNYKQ